MPSILPPVRRSVKERLLKHLRRCRLAAARTRYLIVINLLNRRSAYQTAEVLGVHNTTVYRVARRSNAHGEWGLWDAREDNGQTKLDERFLNTLHRVVRGTPREYGWRRPTWTRELLAETMARQTGVRVHVTTMSRALALVQARRGRPRPVVDCPWGEAAKTRRLNAIRRLINTLPLGEVAVCEVDIHLNPKIGLDWMARGQQKEVVTPGQNAKRYLAGALDARAGRLLSAGEQDRAGVGGSACECHPESPPPDDRGPDERRPKLPRQARPEQSSGRRLRTFGEDLLFGQTWVAISGDGRLALSATWGHAVAVWDAVTGKRLRTLEGTANVITGVALSGDGRRALTGCSDGTAAIWEAATGRRLRTIRSQAGAVTAVALSGDGALALTGSRDGTVVVWDAAGGRALQTIRGQSGPIASVGLSNDGALAATSSGDGTVALRDAGTGARIRELDVRIPPLGVRSMVELWLSGKEKHFLTTGADNVILWDAAGGKMVRQFEGEVAAVDRGGKREVTGYWGDRRAALWDADTGKKLHDLR